MKTYLVIITLVCALVFPLSAFAETYVPDNDLELSSQAETSTSENTYTAPAQTNPRSTTPTIEEDYAQGLFGDSRVDVQGAKTASSEKAVAAVRSKSAWVMSFLIGVFPLLVAAMTVIDVCCILIPPIAWIFTTLIPIQLFSHAAARAAGLQMKSKGQNGQPGMPQQPQQPTTPNATGQPGQAASLPIVTYAKEQFVLIIVSVIIIVCVASGVFFSAVYVLGNLAASALSSIL